MALLLSGYKFVFGAIRKVFVFALTQQSNAIIPHFLDFFKCGNFHVEKFHSHVTISRGHLTRTPETPGTVPEPDKVPDNPQHRYDGTAHSVAAAAHLVPSMYIDSTGIDITDQFLFVSSCSPK